MLEFCNLFPKNTDLNHSKIIIIPLKSWFTNFYLTTSNHYVRFGQLNPPSVPAFLLVVPPHKKSSTQTMKWFIDSNKNKYKIEISRAAMSLNQQTKFFDSKKIIFIEIFKNQVGTSRDLSKKKNQGKKSVKSVGNKLFTKIFANFA